MRLGVYYLFAAVRASARRIDLVPSLRSIMMRCFILLLSICVIDADVSSRG